MSGGTGKRKNILYASGVTVELAVLTIFNLTLGSGVIFSGWAMNRSWPGLHRGDLFLILGSAILLMYIFALIQRFGDSITFTDRSLIYKRSGRPEIHVYYAEMSIFLAPKTSRKWFRTAWLGDHQHLIALDSEAFRDYDLIVNLVDVFRRRRRKAAEGRI